MNLISKTVRESYTEQVHIVRGQYLNGAGRLFGGQILMWIDELAGVVARRHTNTEVVTATVDSVQFKEPAFQNDMVLMSGYVTYVGHTSLEVCVDVRVMDNSGKEREISRAYLVMVSIGPDGDPTQVPELILTTDAEKKEWEDAEKRYYLRKERRREGY